MNNFFNEVAKLFGKETFQLCKISVYENFTDYVFVDNKESSFIVSSNDCLNDYIEEQDAQRFTAYKILGSNGYID